MKNVNENSKRIFRNYVRPSLTESQQKVLKYFELYDEGTSKEVVRWMQDYYGSDTSINEISGRLTELKSTRNAFKRKLIEESGRRKEGCNILQRIRGVRQISLFDLTPQRTYVT